MKFTVKKLTGSGMTEVRFDTEIEAVAHLGRMAGQDDLDGCLHLGPWSDSAYATAYTRNGDPILDAVYVMRRTES